METCLEELVARITAKAKLISSSPLESNDSHPVNEYFIKPSLSAPEPVEQARQDIIYAALEIQQLLSEPSEYLEQHQINVIFGMETTMTHNLLEYANEAVTFHAVAASANVPLSRLKSVARMSMTGGMLTEPRPGHLAHSRVSAQFVKTPTLVDWAKFMTRYSAPTAAKFAEATDRWGDTTEKNQTAYNIAFDTDLPFFKHLTQSEERTANFAAYMRSLGESEGTAFKHILTAFEWGSLGKTNIVDVGGSTGQASILLATHYPELSFIVQDLPVTVANSSSILANLDTSISSRITFSAHDFLSPQPIAIAVTTDIFFLRKIIHDWPPKDARIILSHISAALQKPGACIVIMDTILPEPGSVPAMEEAGLRVRDLTMAQSFNSGERELSEWAGLIGSATPKLKLKEWKKPSGSVMGVMVVVRDEDVNSTK
ncbi:O-methyltransferase aurJ [Lachnellula arida]|uniref:O-methyltransferase aurJ n=1 Tax=Lachnellula arida TaxID=1316785 RepID=A0A8T9BDC1_9HELO|nr:O-methyltransferase aurJ [Lachnellula arida]